MKRKLEIPGRKQLLTVAALVLALLLIFWGARPKDYYKYESCLGVHMADEPLANRFDGIGKIYKAYDELNINDKLIQRIIKK